MGGRPVRSKQDFYLLCHKTLPAGKEDGIKGNKCLLTCLFILHPRLSWWRGLDSGKSTVKGAGGASVRRSANKQGESGEVGKVSKQQYYSKSTLFCYF